MRKKLEMRRGGKVAKYAEGGAVAAPRRGGLRSAQANAITRRMVDEAAAAAEEQDAARRSRITNEPVGARIGAGGAGLISNNPVGSNRAAGRIPIGAPVPMPLEAPLPTPPIPPEDGPPPRRRGRPMPANARSRRREMTADELNEREMTRLLNERSWRAARAGRNMFRKGGKVGRK
jgi:hypothetical protein